MTLRRLRTTGGPYRQVGDKMSVHDVHVQHRATTFDGLLGLRAQLRKV